MHQLHAEATRAQIDETIDAYVDWREACISVSEAYERWGQGPVGEAGLAFAAYRAALDREEHASRAYAQCLTGMPPVDLDHAL